jgi:hypothetical protein
MENLHTTLLALVLRALGPGHDAVPIAHAIVGAVEADAGNAPLTGSHAEDALVMAVFARRESNANVRPRPLSWDARGGISCGAWQMRCSFTRWHSLAEQAKAWLQWARSPTGLAGLCGYGPIARRMAASRQLEAHQLLVDELGVP